MRTHAAPVAGRVPPAEGGPRCLNCGALLIGRYCAACGQEARVADPPARLLAREMLAEALGADSRTWRTLRLLLLRPGTLTAEYFAGRRARYLGPLRTYLLLSAPFLAIVLFTPAGESMFQVQPPEALAVSPERFRETFFDVWPWLLVALLPAFAAVYALLLWRLRASFTRHLVFTLHLHSFGFASLTGAGLVWYVPPEPVGAALAGILVFAPAVYLVVALRRAYAVSWGASLLVALGAGFLGTLVASGSALLAFATAVWVS